MSSFPCPWKCCNLSHCFEINQKLFWKNIQGTSKCDNSHNLLCEKNIYLNAAFGSMIVVGINPKDEFNVYARIENRSTNNSILINEKNLSHLLDCVSEQFSINSVFPSSSSSNFTRTPEDAVRMQITSFHQRFFKISIGENQIKIDEDSLLRLLRLDSYVRSIILMLQSQSKTYESFFFNLLSHFCYEKSVEEAIQLSELEYIQHFFDEVINFHCECIDKSFILEIATNFSQWFATCIPLFIKSIMINEKSRYHSFSFDWPHKETFLNINILAKSGLYFTGRNDRVVCAFCNLNLRDWEKGDDPIQEHLKYSPRCKFLADPFNTPNVADGSMKQLSEKLSFITKNKGRDEVDKKQEEKENMLD